MGKMEAGEKENLSGRRGGVTVNWLLEKNCGSSQGNVTNNLFLSDIYNVNSRRLIKMLYIQCNVLHNLPVLGEM